THSLPSPLSLHELFRSQHPRIGGGADWATVDHPGESAAELEHERDGFGSGECGESGTGRASDAAGAAADGEARGQVRGDARRHRDRKSTRLNSSHVKIS